MAHPTAARRLLCVAAPTSQRLRAGESIGLRIDPAACVPLADTE